MKFVTLLSVFAVALLSGCATMLPATGGMSYVESEARRVQQVQVGVVSDVRSVVIRERSGTSQVTGTGLGAGLGGLVGSTMGKGKGNTAAILLGMALGGLGGNAAESRFNTVAGLEFVVTLTSGQMLSVTQAADPDGKAIAVGDVVWIISGSSNTRVVKARQVGNK